MPIERTGMWRSRIDGALGDGSFSRVSGYFTRRMFVMLLIVGGLIALLFGWFTFRSHMIATFMKAMPKDQTISAVHPRATLWQTELRSVGSVHSVQGADLASEVAGLVTRIGFRPGEDVRAGTLLVQLRDDSERAAADLAVQTFKRYAALIKTQAISQSNYDSALASMKSARAAVEKKAIRAPYDGRVGIRQVDVGQYVNAGQVIVTLQQLDPIYVDFQVPQQQLAQLKVGDKVTLTTDAAAGRSFDGHITAFDPKVDLDTRNVRVRATIGNPDKVLLPGMFASVRTRIGSPRTQLTLPQTALTFNPYGDTVFVVEKTGEKDKDGQDALVARQRFITIGDMRGDQVAIVSGLTANDLVVSSGQIKLKNGTPVHINNSVPLPNEPAPTPSQQ